MAERIVRERLEPMPRIPQQSLDLPIYRQIAKVAENALKYYGKYMFDKLFGDVCPKVEFSAELEGTPIPGSMSGELSDGTYQRPCPADCPGPQPTDQKMFEVKLFGRIVGVGTIQRCGLEVGLASTEVSRDTDVHE